MNLSSDLFMGFLHVNIVQFKFPKMGETAGTSFMERSSFTSLNAIVNESTLGAFKDEHVL